MRILLVDPVESDRALTTKLLQLELPDAVCVGIDNHAGLLRELGRGGADLLIAAVDPGGITIEELQAVLAETESKPAIVVTGEASHLATWCRDAVSRLDGIVAKTSAGYTELSEIVKAIIADRTMTGSLALSEIPVPAFYARSDGQITRSNHRFDAIYRRDMNAVQPITVESLCSDADAGHSWHTLTSGETEEIELRLADGAGSSRLARVARNQDHDNSFLGLLIEARSAEISVVQSGDHAADIRDLQHMAMLFSHDLKEPVQQIVRLVAKLDEREESAMDPSAVREHLRASASRASGMLDSMVEYLAVSSREQKPEHVDLDSCLEEALDNLRGSIDENEARIVSDHLPSIEGDRLQLLHLFQNLIGNAIKFRGRERPQIRITSDEVDQRWHIAIHDNGIGIAQGQRERIFDLSQRLHTREEYPGHGLGLSMCRRICENHGGSIWVESNDNGGSTFVIDLPNRHKSLTRRA